MTVEQMLSRDEIECAAARSFGNKDFQVQQYEAWDSELLFSTVVALKLPGL